MRVLVTLAVLVSLFSFVGLSPAEDKKDAEKVEKLLPEKGSKTVYVVTAGRDAIVYVPEGLKWQGIESPTLKIKFKSESRSDGGIVVTDRVPVYQPIGRDYVTLRFTTAKTLTKQVEVGLPDGYDGKTLSSLKELREALKK